MSDELIEFEEEEFTSQLNGAGLPADPGLFRPHWKWVVGFLLTIALAPPTWMPTSPT